VNCWICGNPADSGEHIIKASDLKSEMGAISQKFPIYLQSTEETNVRVNSLRKSKELKFDQSICSNCNNARTSCSDKAWQTLSSYLRNNIDFKGECRVKIGNIFKGNANSQMKNVQLYFAKIFGCAVVSESVPVSLENIQSAILANDPCENLYITFGISPFTLFSAGVSDISLSERRGAQLAIWHYYVGKLMVRINFIDPASRKLLPRKAWHPTDKGKFIRVCKL